MHPASSRPSRSGVRLKVGPVEMPVDVFSGTYNAPSATSACVGTENHQHDPTKVSNHKVCSICSANQEVDGDVGIIKSARSSGRGKLAVIEQSAVAKALEVADEHREQMPVVRVPREVYEASALESADVYWLQPGAGASEELYAGLAASIAESDQVFVTRWASQKNVYLYRLVSRAGLLGLIKLKPMADLRAAPTEPPALTDGGKAMAQLALGMVAEVGDQAAVAELAENPYKKTLELAADKALEDGRKSVRMSGQSRNKFSDNLAAASLAAMLEEADL